eukprot:14349620-Alexandrium_andersonii.AAC.1
MCLCSGPLVASSLLFAWTAEALRLQRTRVGATVADRAMLLCDGFKGNYSYAKGEDVRRMKWGAQHNCGFMPEPPGGWGARL